jgi:2,5-diamino-6-(ribosylamino)-4(3H)-pyrimidinone 5'-phosphate reductase
VPSEHEEMFRPPSGAPDTRPLLVIADSRGRVRCWDTIRKWPFTRDVLALCSSATPQDYLQYLADRKIGSIIAGADRIDMRAALAELNLQHGVNTVRVDSGGTLNSVLLQAGVVSEMSVLIHPFLSGGQPGPTMFDPEKAGFPNLQVSLTHLSTEVVGDGIVWLRYSVAES